jgi:metallo-beta-lactamase class B/metallo-beta-lactamase class B GIM
VLFGGCLVRSAASRSLGYTKEADLEEWPQTIVAVRDSYGGARLIVPGHGSPGGKELFEHTLELLAAQRAQANQEGGSTPGAAVPRATDPNPGSR